MVKLKITLAVSLNNISWWRGGSFDMLAKNTGAMICFSWEVIQKPSEKENNLF